MTNPLDTLADIKTAVDAARLFIETNCRDCQKKERLPMPEVVPSYEECRFKVIVEWSEDLEGILAFHFYGATNYDWLYYLGGRIEDSGTSLLDGVRKLRAMLKEGK